MATAVAYNGGRLLKTHASEGEFREAVKVYKALDLPSVDTPQADVEEIEKLLGVEPGFFNEYDFEMKFTPNSGCKGCGRKLNWLDVCHTALATPGHTPDFILGTFAGEHGLVLAPPFRALTCSCCNTVQDLRRENLASGYNCKSYMCMGG